MSAPLAPSSAITPPAAATTAADNYTDLNGLAALKNAPRSAAAVRAVAEQVEALFLQMMLKSMRDATEAQGETESNETSMYQDMFDKQVALTLSKHQDLGIARLFERELGAKSPAAGAAPPAAAPLPKTLPQRPTRTADGRASGADGGSNSAVHAARFVSEVLPTISRVAKGLGVDPLGLLAQAALETGWGQRMPRTAEGGPSHNMFGIKAGDDWSGARAVADTLEFSGGVATPRRTAFRAYGSIEESVSDFARLLATSPRYRGALAAGGSAQAYVESIAQSGYATDPDYGNKLNQILNSGTLRAALKTRTVAL